MAVAVAGGDGGECLQAVGWDPFAFAGFFVGDLDGIASDQSAENRLVCAAVIGEIFVLRSEQLLRGLVLAELLGCFVDATDGDPVSADPDRRQREDVDPVERLFLAL